MRGEVAFPVEQVLTPLLLLARVGGIFAFVRMPGSTGSPEMAKVALTIAITAALLPVAPAAVEVPGIGGLAAAILREAALGIGIGVALAITLEALVLMAQIAGLQAGYGYASTIDPTTEADSGILQVLTQLVAMLLFFATGLHRELIRAIARSLETVSLGGYAGTAGHAAAVIQLGAAMVSTGLRIALPVVVMLMLLDIAVALAGRVSANLQLLSIAFPAKMLLALIVLAALAASLPSLFSKWSGDGLAVMKVLIGG